MDGFDWKHPTDAMKGYKSPVNIYYSDILEPVKEAADNYIMSEIKMYVDVDKDELIKAMNYDRNQYATGYRNGYADAKKHGKWIPVRSYEAFGGDKTMWEIRGNPVAFYYCSECRNDAYAGEDGESLLTKYCPNCGADMRIDG